MGRASSILAWVQRPVGGTSSLVLAAIVYCGFVTLHAGLAHVVPPWVDVDELQYGDLGFAILDGLGEDSRWARMRGREGFPAVFGRLTAPFLAVFGEHLLALRLAFVSFAGSWAVLWALVARQLAPRVPAWAVAALFIVPAPFVSRYAVSPMGMSVHLGVSTVHGLAVLLLLRAWRARGVRRWAYLLAAGLASGFGVLGGPLMLMLLSGVAVAAALVASWRGLVVWGVGALPGLAWAFALPSRLAGLWASPGPAVLPIPAEVVEPMDLSRPWSAILYIPGYLPPEGWAGNYLAAGLLYFGFIAAIYSSGWLTDRKSKAPLCFGLVISAATLLISIAWVRFTPFGLDRFGWDAPRYAVPLLPIAAIAFLVGCSRLASASRPAAAAIAALLVLAHAIGFGGHVAFGLSSNPFVSPRWVRGHTSAFELNVFPVRSIPDTPRRRTYAMRQGMAVYVPSHPTNVRVARSWGRSIWERAEHHQPAVLPDDPIRMEYWRGFGRLRFLAQARGDLRMPYLWEFSEDVYEAIWQGIGMQAHECDFGMERTSCPPEAVVRLLPRTEFERAAYAWGWSRACHDDDHAPIVVPFLHTDPRLGRRLRWEYDLASPEAPVLTDDELEQVVIIRWRP